MFCLVCTFLTTRNTVMGDSKENLATEIGAVQYEVTRSITTHTQHEVNRIIGESLLSLDGMLVLHRITSMKSAAWLPQNNQHEVTRSIYSLLDGIHVYRGLPISFQSYFQGVPSSRPLEQERMESEETLEMRLLPSSILTLLSFPKCSSLG